MTITTAIQQTVSAPSLIARFAARFGVEPNKMLGTLKATAFRQRGADPEPTNEQMMALLVVADQYGLNPWTKEIYAFPDKGGIVPVVGLDGWSRIVNDHPQFDGVEFEFGPALDKHKGAPEWIECIIYRKDREHPTRVRERMVECYRSTGPWDSHPSRMLRHKAFMQAGRLAFSFVGIYDEDEAHRILEGESSRVPETAPSIAAINATIAPPKPAPAIEHQPIDAVPTQVLQEPEPVAAEATPARQAKGSKAKAAAPTFTYAEIADRLQKAGDADQLAEAMSLIDAIGEENLRVELQQLAEHRERTLMGEG